MIRYLKTKVKGSLHVVWQVSFGCWITWCISSWQNSYKSVFFPKAEWWVSSRTSFSVSQQLRPELSAEWILSILSDVFHKKNWEKYLLFNLANFWMIKLTKTPILPNSQVPNSFFWYNCKFYHSKIPITQLWERRHFIRILSASYLVNLVTYCTKIQLFLQKKRCVVYPITFYFLVWCLVGICLHSA